MFNEEDLFKNHKVLESTTLSGEPGNGEHFRIHIEPKHEVAHEPHPHGHNVSSEPLHHHNSAKTHQKRGAKDILKDGARQIIASAVFLLIGFFILNWSAYSKLIINKWNGLIGNESPLTEIVEVNDIVYNADTLKTSADPEVQKKQIPPLNMEIAPISDRIIIPRIDQNIPIISVSSENLIKRDWGALENEIQDALKDGVVHYPGTSLPGQKGNVVITGHSSYFPWDSGRFKDVFALLHDVVVGDRIVVYHGQDKYLYEVNDIKVVLPQDIDVLKQTPEDQLTLITCTPIGTNLKRLIVTAKPIAKNGVTIEENTELNEQGRLLR